MSIRPLRVPFVLALLSSVAVAQTAIVLPNVAASVEGNTSNSYPWAYGSRDVRTQWIYSSAQLAGVTGPVLVQRLRYRADNAFGSGGSWTGGSWGQVQIDLSTAARRWNGASLVFDDNHGLDRTTVIDGAVTMQPGTYAGGNTTVPGPWYIDIPIGVPFVYDPSGGDLCIDLMVEGSTWTGGSRRAADHEYGSQAQACRIYSTAGANAPMGLIDNNYALVVEVTVAPLPPLQPWFVATPTRGASPLQVDFTDRSVSTAPGGVLAWSWDFDNDGVIDSTLQNPSWNYAGCGTFSVALTVNDGVNAPATLVRSGQVVTDELAPDFDYFLVGPNLLQFVDATTPTPTAWAWDLDGDGVTDSTVASPIFFYPTGMECGEIDVGLTVTRLCRGPVTLQRRIAVAQSLTTRFDGNFNSSTSTTGGTNYFDLDVLTATGVAVCGLHCNVSGGAGSAITANVYATPGSYVGKHQDASAWRLIATGSATSRGVMERTFVPLDFYLTSGSYGIAVQLLGRAPAFSNITANQTFANLDLSLTAGIAQAEPIFGGSSQVLSTRIWNGSLHYTTANVVADAGYGFFGAGCAGSMGISSLTPDVLPALGNTINVTIDNLPQSVAIMMTGFSKTAWALGALPYDLTSLGVPGCYLRVSPDANLLLLGTGNQAVWTFTVPPVSSLLGLQMFNQAVVLDPGFNARGAVGSDAHAMQIGN